MYALLVTFGEIKSGLVFLLAVKMKSGMVINVFAETNLQDMENNVNLAPNLAKHLIKNVFVRLDLIGTQPSGPVSRNANHMKFGMVKNVCVRRIMEEINLANASYAQKTQLDSVINAIVLKDLIGMKADGLVFLHVT